MRLSRALLTIGPVFALTLTGCGASSRTAKPVVPAVSAAPTSRTATPNATQANTTTVANVSCPKSVDNLNAVLLPSSGLNTDAIDKAAIASLKACDGSATWTLYADMDHIGNLLGAISGTDHTPMSTSTALDSLCLTYDAKNATATCSIR